MVTAEYSIRGPAGWLSIPSKIEKFLKLSVNRSRGNWDLHWCGRAETGTNQKSLSTFPAPGWLCGDPSTAKPLCRGAETDVPLEVFLSAGTAVGMEVGGEHLC